MDIGLINRNRVVSRLFALSLKNTPHRLIEAPSVKELDQSVYDIVFVDEGVKDEIHQALKIETDWLIYISLHPEAPNGFHEVLKKPFMPSAVIELVKRYEAQNNQNENKQGGFLFPMRPEEPEDDTEGVLDLKEIEQIKQILQEESNTKPSKEIQDQEEMETKKREVIKASLEANGLEIIEEEAIVSQIEASSQQHTNEQIAEETVAILLNRFEAYVRSAKPKKIRKLLMGKKTKIKLP